MSGDNFDPDEWADRQRPGGCVACGSHRFTTSTTLLMADPIIKTCQDCGHQTAEAKPGFKPTTPPVDLPELRCEAIAGRASIPDYYRSEPAVTDINYLLSLLREKDGDFRSMRAERDQVIAHLKNANDTIREKDQVIERLEREREQFRTELCEALAGKIVLRMEYDALKAGQEARELAIAPFVDLRSYSNGGKFILKDAKDHDTMNMIVTVGQLRALMATHSGEKTK